MGGGEHFVMFHQQQQHHHQDHVDEKMSIPKGCVAVVVGHEDEEHKRFVIPLTYINHPLFKELLKETEKEYGFDHEGPINIPCRVQDFYKVQTTIDRDLHRHHNICCFKD